MNTDYILLLDFDKYCARFYDHTQNCRTNQEAWQRTEDDVFKATGKRRYSSYDSFRVVRDRARK